MIVRHPPPRAYELEAPEQPLHGLPVVILLPAVGIHRGDPPPPGVVDARTDNAQPIHLLHAPEFDIAQHLHGLPPVSVSDVEAHMMGADLAVSPHRACHLREPAEAVAAAGGHGAPLGTPEPHCRWPLSGRFFRVSDGYANGLGNAPAAPSASSPAPRRHRYQDDPGAGAPRHPIVAWRRDVTPSRLCER
jgi:hypothetical protein